MDRCLVVKFCTWYSKKNQISEEALGESFYTGGIALKFLENQWAVSTMNFSMQLFVPWVNVNANYGIEIQCNFNALHLSADYITRTRNFNFSGFSQELYFGNFKFGV